MERLEIIEALKHLPDTVATETKGLSEAMLRHRPREGERSIKEIVGHLRDAAEVWHKRIYMVCTLTDPVVASWEKTIGFRESTYLDADLSRVIAEMRDWRLKTVDALDHAVDWTRIGSQLGVGRRSLKQFAEILVEHDAAHVASIRELRTAQAARQPR